MLEYMAGAVIVERWVREFRLEEIGLVSRPKIIRQAGEPSRRFERTDRTRQFFLRQSGIGDFGLRQVPDLKDRLSNKEYGPDNIHNGSYSRLSRFEDLPVLDYANADDHRKLRRIVEGLGKELTREDLFYFATSRHGAFDRSKNPLRWLGRKVLRVGRPMLADFYDITDDKRDARGKNTTYFGRPGDYRISVDELEDMFSPVTESGAVSVLYIDTCFGGDFAKRMGRGNTIAISPVRPGKLLTSPAPSQNLMTGEWEDQSIPSPSYSREGLERAMFMGNDLVTSFMRAGDDWRWKNTWGIFWRPIINQPRMYVGDVNPSSVSFK